jgi:hypothetical protein
VADEDDVVEVFPFEDVDQVLHEDVSVMFFEIRWERSPRPVWVGVYTRWPAAGNGSATRLQHQPPCQAPCSSTNVFVLPAAGPARPAAQRAVPTLAIAAAVAARNVRLPCITSSLRDRSSLLREDASGGEVAHIPDDGRPFTRGAGISSQHHFSRLSPIELGLGALPLKWTSLTEGPDAKIDWKAEAVDYEWNVAAQTDPLTFLVPAADFRGRRCRHVWPSFSMTPSDHRGTEP